MAGSIFDIRNFADLCNAHAVCSIAMKLSVKPNVIRSSQKAVKAPAVSVRIKKFCLFAIPRYVDISSVSLFFSVEVF